MNKETNIQSQFPIHDSRLTIDHFLPLRMTIHEARQQIISSLIEIYDDREAGNISELVMEKVTNLSRIDRISNKEISLSLSQEETLKQYIQRLKQHEPVQYLINEAWFAGMRFYVDKSVLIPRPETEELVDWIINDVRDKIQDADRSAKTLDKRILDIGTGSGCIAITLKKNLPGTEVWACDISDEALTTARKNADTMGALIDFVALDFLDANQRKQLPSVDIIVSNPPYIPEGNKTEMRKNIIDYEPALALFVDDNDPLIFYNSIADFGKEKLNKGGKIYLEIHEDLGIWVHDLFLEKGYSSVDIKQDMQGKERMIKVEV